MAREQLSLLIKLYSEKEEKLRIDYLQAQQHLNALNQQLEGLKSFRADYMHQLHAKAQNGLTSTSYNQFQAFINKLEQALVEQMQSISTAEKVVTQRKDLWLKQKSQLEAIMKLQDKKREKALHEENKKEQKQLDEFATNLFMRNKSGLA